MLALIQIKGLALALGWVSEQASDDRDGALVMAHLSGGYTQKELGQHFGLHYACISRIVGSARAKT